MDDIRFIQGNEAVAEGALYAGCRFYSGYPITPSTEVAEILARKLPTYGGKFIQMEDEIGAMAATIGASIVGLKSCTATSGPGFSLKQENIGFACMIESPCVIINVMRGGPSTGAPTGPSQADIMQARWGTHGDHPVIALAPASVYEQFTETVRAFNLAEKYRTPVILLTDEIIGHMREKFTMPKAGQLEIINRKQTTADTKDFLPFKEIDKLGVPVMADFGRGYRYHLTGLNHDETGFPTQDAETVDKFQRRLVDKVEKNADDIIQYEEYQTNDAEILIIAIGSSARSAKAAVNTLRESGRKVGLFRPKTVWPFPEKKLLSYAKKVKGVMVVEMNLGQMYKEVQTIFHRDMVRGLFRVDTEPIKPLQIVEKFNKEYL